MQQNIVGVMALVGVAVAVPLQAQVIQAPAPVTPMAIEPALIEVPTVAPQQIILRRDTPVHLMVMNEVSTKERSAGFRFKLRVNEPVLVSGVIVVPAGTLAYGEVMSAEPSGNVGKSGRLSARLLNIDLGGRAIGISGETTAKGKSGTGEVVAAVFGLGLLGLFAKGNNAKIKAGELMTGFTTDNTTLDVTAAKPRTVQPPVSLAPLASNSPTISR